MTRVLALDTETFLMTQGDMAPLVVCASYAFRNGTDLVSGLVHHSQCEQFLYNLFTNCLQAKITVVGHNIAYDMACIQRSYPSLIDLIWQLYDSELIEDTIIRQKLSDLARGRYRGFRTDSGYFVVLNYDLAAVTKRHLGYELEKDEWRKKYGTLYPYPLEQWPEGARIYPVKDAVATLEVREVQEQESQIFPEGPWFFVDQHPQVRAAWALHLISVHGIMTSEDAVERLREATEAEIQHLEGALVDVGLVEIAYKNHRPDKDHPERWVERKATRKLDRVRSRVLHACREQDKLPRFSETGKEVIAAAAKGKISYSEKGKPRSSDLTKYISIDKDACLETGDPLLEWYIDYSSALKTLNADIEAYSRGTKLPLHTRFESLAATGRTTSSGQTLEDADGNKTSVGTNIQNVRWNFPERCTNPECRARDVKAHICQRCGAPAAYPPGIRECFVPRSGFLFATSDYDQLELRTLAQVCLKTVGFSVLADVLNSGKDPHMIVAAEILQRPYDWCMTNKDTSEVTLARQTAKVANFGFPGGLGAEKLVLFARMAYHVTMTVEDARKLKQTWMRAYPEMREYFKWVEGREDADGTFSIEHIFSRRLRSKIFYCVACNSPFQGLGADAAKAALYLVVRACYYDRSSPLYGCRIVNFIHDEIIAEVPDDEADGYVRANAAANELSRLMVVGGSPYLPQVPLKTAPLLARRWSKKAKRKVVDGKLIPWDLPVAA